MWIYQHVDGDVHGCFDDVLTSLAALEHAWRARTERVELRTRCEALERAVNAAREKLLVPELARAGYLATLELAAFLDRHCDEQDQPLAGATWTILEFLEEWRPYITIEDAALNFVMLDGISLEEGLAVLRAMERRALEDDADDDCPLCMAMGL
jgi:hypothetical protein